jgi:hypothetical protein
MYRMVKIAISLLGVVFLTNTVQAEPFFIACTFDGGAASFTASGDYIKHTASISRVDGSRMPAYVTLNFRTASAPTLVLLLRGKSKADWAWRDLYIVDTAQGTFSHVNENWPDGPDSDPSMIVQGGTCASSRP